MVGVPFLGGGDDETPTRRKDPKVIEVDEELSESVRKREIAAGPVLDLVPYDQPQDVDTSQSFFRDVFRCERGGDDWRQNQSTPWSFEPYYDPDEGTIRFRYVADSDAVRSELRQGLEAAYHDSDITQEPPQFLDVEPGMAASSARMTLQDPEALKPINNPAINPGDFAQDPRESFTRRMAGDDGEEAGVLTQTMFMPAISHASNQEGNEDLNWHHGVEDVAEDLRSPDESFRWTSIPELILDSFTDENEDVAMFKERDASGQDEAAASLVENQKNKHGYHVNIRVVAIADRPEVARKRVRRVCGKYENFYNSTTGQGFRPVYDVDVGDLIKKAARRSWVDRGMPFGLDEALALGAPPTTLSTPEAVKTHRSSDQGTPANNPDFDEFDETGYTEAFEEGS